MQADRLDARHLQVLPQRRTRNLTQFCAEHSSIDSHGCPEHQKHFKKVFICPLCEQPISVNPNLQVDENVLCSPTQFSIHEATECPHRIKAQDVQRCGKCRQKLTELNSHSCKQCDRLYCLK